MSSQNEGRDSHYRDSNKLHASRRRRGGRVETLTRAVCGEARPARSGLLWQHLEAGGGADAQEEEEEQS